MVSEFGQQILSQHRLFASVLVTMLLSVALRLLEPWPLKLIIDRLSGAPLPSLPTTVIAWVEQMSATAFFLGAAGVFLLTNVLRAFFTYTNIVTLALAGSRVLTQVRALLYGHLLRLPLTFHTGARNGELVNILIGDISRLQDVTVTALMPLLINFLTLTGMLGVMLWMNWRLALLALAVLPLLMPLMSRTSGRIRDVGRKQRKQEGALAANTAESLSACLIIQALRGRTGDATGVSRGAGNHPPWSHTP